jgi:DNA-binding beta-propeller fold protein YncE
MTNSQFVFEPNQRWAQLPADYRGTEIPGVAIDRQDRVFVFSRGGDHPVMVFSANGKFLYSWGKGVFSRPHGISIAPDGNVYCSDDFDHTVRKFTPEGQLLMTLGTSGKPSDTGATSIDFRTVRYAGPPFNYPCNVAFGPDGNTYIADGYGNTRIHVFTADGRLLFSWGEPGSGPGQFRLPHGIAVGKDGTVYVADRENSRIQLFSPDGKYLTEWTDVARPCQVAIDGEGYVYVAELGFRAAMWPGTVAPSPDATGGRLSIFTAQGKLLARFGGGKNPTAPGDFLAPHDVRIDSKGAVYVGEVIASGGGTAACHSLQKLTPVTK